MQIENEFSLLKSFETGINLFIGAGFSIEAKDLDGNTLPDGKKLRDELLDKFNLGEYSTLDLSQLSSILEAERKEEFYNFLTRRFSVNDFNPLYLSLLKLNINAIITTNIDDLMFKVFTKSDDLYLNDLTINGPVYHDRYGIDYIPLHGCVKHDPKDFILSKIDIASAFSIDPDKWHFLTERVQKKPTLFWGYNLEDAGVLQALNKATIRNRDHKEKWILLRSEDKNAIKYFKSLDFHIIIGETKEFLEYIHKLKLRKTNFSENSISLFPEYAIPSLDKVSARPITEFFLGAPPTWYDIYSGKICKLSHYYEIKNSIYSRKHTVVIGLPACGKTTLMMQIAKDIVYDGYKLVCNSLALNQVKIILNKIKNRKALLFIDNFTDDIEAIEEIYKYSNIQFVAFDRFYFFDLISHKINTKNTNIIEISNLSQKDIQNIYNTIPEFLKKQKIIYPKIIEDDPPSLFEVIQANISKADLDSRFVSLLKDLKDKKPELYYLLLMCCYVHSCRTLVSFDMVYAFLRRYVNTYKQVYSWLDQLGELIKDISEPIVDLPNQDYFVPRSTFLSEKVIDLSPSNDLKKMLLQFHNEVSSFRIPKYNVFKRRAFDANIISKAFINWEEGLDFYQKIEERDSSPYLKQQCALYLAHKKRFKEAFQWIDSALVDSNYKIPTISNSHAIILFRANIDNPNDPTAKESIQKSMYILAECYKYDKRKTYHALVYADHALQYANFFHDEQTIQYLTNAQKWLKEEISKFPWNRKCSRLLKLVSKKLEIG